MAPRERGSWSNHWEFLLTSLGMAVGLGNVWRFPYVTYANGGGTFLIPYLLCLAFMAWPVLFQEMAMGQISRAGCNKVFPAMAPIFKGLAHAMIYLRTSAQVYFMVITSWAFYFLFAGFQSELPWSTCTADWNTKDCYSILFNDECSTDNVFFNFTCSSKLEYCQWHGYESWDDATDSCVALQGEETSVVDVLSVYSVSPAEDYLNGKVLGLTKDQDGTQYTWTDYGSMQWELILCQLLGWLIVSGITIRGIRSLGKAAYVLTMMPYVLLTILLVYSVTLEGAADGIDYFLKPDWEKLTDSNVWLQASIQIATSTAIACGSHLVLASFNPKTNNVLTDSIVIAVLNSLTSVYAGFVVFSMTGFLAHETRTSVDNVVTSGITLAFVTYPSAFLEMVVPPLWSFLFFLMLVNLAMSGLTASNQVIVSYITDEWPQLGSYQTAISVLIPAFCFLCGLPFTCNGGIHLFTLIDQRGSVTSLALALLQCLVISWIYGMRNFFADLAAMQLAQPKWAKWLWCFVLMFLSPAAFAYMYIYSLVDIVPMAYGSYVYPDSVQSIGLFILIIPLLFIAIYAIWFVIKTKRRGHSWKEVAIISFKTSADWRDQDSDDTAPIIKDD